MANLFGKIAGLIICISMTSCSFDGKDIEVLSTIGKHYYALSDLTANYGIQIGYSLNNETYQIIESYCDKIYCNNDTIMYSKKILGKDSVSLYYIILYYIILQYPERTDGLANEPIQIKKEIFQHNIERFTKVNIPDKGNR